MPTTIARPLTNGSGVALTNGSAVPLYEAGLGAGDLIKLLGGGINWDAIVDVIASWLGTDRLTLANAVLALFALVPLAGDMINQVTEEGILAIVAGLDGMNSSTPLTEPGTKLTLGNIRQAETALGNDIAAISTQISGLPAPPTPPTADENAAAVWALPDPNNPDHAPYGDEQNEPYQLALAMNDYLAIRVQDAAHFWAHAYFGDIRIWTNLRDTPQPDWGDVHPGETRLHWLNRTEPLFTWDESATGIIHGVYTSAGGNAPDWWFDLSEAEFQRLVSTTTWAGPPIWPGAAGAVDGTPVVVTSPQLVVGPMHGCHVSIDAVDPGTGDEIVGTHHNRKFAGWLAFVSDVGEVEQFQYLNQNLATYSPKAMSQAASVLVFLKQASQVTVTPWLLS